MSEIKLYTMENEEKIPILVREATYDYDIGIFYSPQKIAKMMNDVFRLNRKSEEYVYLLAMDTKCNLIGVFEISHGTVNSSLLNPREILIRGLLCGASNMVVVHNHPSGDSTPSREDMKIAKRIQDAAEIVGIELCDFIIIGNEYLSFKERELI